MADTKRPDNWTSEAYQASASFVPKLATKVVSWLDVQPGDRILDVGCGDGVLTAELASHLSAAAGGSIHGIDSSPSMISTAKEATSHTPKSSTAVSPTYSVLDATSISATAPSLSPPYTAIFSNAALHWILRAPQTRAKLFSSFAGLLAPGGRLVFEMGGHGNISELHSVLVMACARRIGIAKAREVDPWFFADEKWMRDTLAGAGFEVRRMELEGRPTRATEGVDGGVEGWLRLMGKTFLDAVEAEKGVEEREMVVREVVEALETVSKREGEGTYWLGYVRLRVEAKKV